jgi:DNA-binding response OmpR family regulator
MVRVLVVDDEPGVAEALQLHLKFKGYEALTALSGEEAIRKVQAEPPDLMLLDVLMPKMGGLEVLARIRQLDPNVGVIIVTAVRDERLGLQALALGASDFLTKPVDLTYLDRSMWAVLTTRMVAPEDDASMVAPPDRTVPFADHLIYLHREAGTWRYAITHKPPPGRPASLPPDARWSGPFPKERDAIKDAQRQIVTQHF